MDGTPPIVLGETVLRPRREVSRSLERRPLGRACRRDVRRSEPGTMLGRLAAGPSGSRQCDSLPGRGHRVGLAEAGATLAAKLGQRL
jgi:hypothetical protein